MSYNPYADDDPEVGDGVKLPAGKAVWTVVAKSKTGGVHLVREESGRTRQARRDEVEVVRKGKG